MIALGLREILPVCPDAILINLDLQVRAEIRKQNPPCVARRWLSLVLASK